MHLGWSKRRTSRPPCAAMSLYQFVCVSDHILQITTSRQKHAGRYVGINESRPTLSSGSLISWQDQGLAMYVHT